MPDSQPEDFERNPESQPGPEAEAEGATDVKEDTADSSGADEGGDLLAEMKAALGSEGGETPDSESDQEAGTAEAEPEAKQAGEESEGEDDGEELSDDPTEEELSRYHSKTRRRVKKLLEQRDGLKQQLEAYEPKAQGFDQVLEFTQKNNLTPDDVNVIFELGSLVKNNPRAALERIEPIYQQLRQIAGETLSPDLQERVRLGYMTEQDALQVSRARAAQTHSQQEAQRYQQQLAAQQQREHQQQHVGAIRTAVSEWESSKAGSDPDWKLKSPRVTELIELELHRKGMPQTPQEATAVADRAYAKATEELKRLAPRKQEVRPVTGRSSDHQAPQPASMEEAMKQALGQ